MSHYDERKMRDMINHALEEQRQKLRRCLRNTADWHEYGTFCIEDERTGELISGHVDPLQLGRELGVFGENDSIDYR